MACPTPAKDKHPDPISATASAAHAVVRRGGYIRIYLCQCGSYHLTHKHRADLGR